MSSLTTAVGLLLSYRTTRPGFGEAQAGLNQPNRQPLFAVPDGNKTSEHQLSWQQLHQMVPECHTVTLLLRRFLMPLHQLKVLWLSDNPCADIPNYRSFVIAHLTSLEKLDNLDITPEERKAAHSIPLMQPATASELLETEDTGPGAASGTSPRPISPSSIAASGTSPRPMSPSSIAGSAAAGSPVPAGPQPPSSRSRVPGGSAAVHADPYSSHAAPMGLLVGNSSSRDSAYDATIGSVSSSGAAAAGRSAAGVAEESFAFSRQQYDPHRYSSQPGMPPVQQQLPQLPRPDAAVPTNSNSNSSSSGAGSSHMKASPNVLYAVMALLAELDAAGLSIVQKEVEQRLKG